MFWVYRISESSLVLQLRCSVVRSHVELSSLLFFGYVAMPGVNTCRCHPSQSHVCRNNGKHKCYTLLHCHRASLGRYYTCLRFRELTARGRHRRQIIRDYSEGNMTYPVLSSSTYVIHFQITGKNPPICCFFFLIVDMEVREYIYIADQHSRSLTRRS
uniref:Uncharacterized protein n=1 Tax=Bionectria ochroleuca TaxID=29856 RepID=A0A0B7JZK4_BIOOC